MFAQTLDEFWDTRNFCRNLPFVNIPLFVTSLEVLPDPWWLLPNSPFSQIYHFPENPQLSICLFCCLFVSILAKFAAFAKYVIFVNPQLSTCLFFHLLFLPNLSILVKCALFVNNRKVKKGEFAIFTSSIIDLVFGKQSCFQFLLGRL